jgi:hypothetical protein
MNMQKLFWKGDLIHWKYYVHMYSKNGGRVDIGEWWRG